MIIYSDELGNSTIQALQICNQHCCSILNNEQFR